MRVLLRFLHGLGDCAQFCVVLDHLRRHRPELTIDVLCGPGRASLLAPFCRAAVEDPAAVDLAAYDVVRDLPWWECHEAYPDRPSTKTAQCLRDEFGLMYEDEPVALPADAGRDRLVAAYAATLPGPFAVCHFHGNTSASLKDLARADAHAACRELLDRGLTPVVLDWDDRTRLADDATIFTPGRGHALWGGSPYGDGATIAALIARARLMVGIDSGPAHVAQLTATPTVMAWTGHHPVHYADPRGDVLHVVPPWHEGMVRGADPAPALAYYRAHYRSIEGEGGEGVVAAIRRGLGVAGPEGPSAPLVIVPESPGDVHFDFRPHGLGDAAAFAHVVALAVRRGHRVAVDCTADKACLFEAAGATIRPAAPHWHPFPYPPGVPATEHWGDPAAFPPPDPARPWVRNKIGHALNCRPLPDLGGPESAWEELVGVRLRLPCPAAERERVDAVVGSLPRPLILLHLVGTNSGAAKNPSRHEQVLVVHELLDRADGTLVHLDWDERVAGVPSRRVRHMVDEFGRLELPGLAYLMERADLIVGVDSGPLHLVRWTDTPAVGWWSTHHPAYFALPRGRTLSVVPAAFAEADRAWGHLWHSVPTPGPVRARAVAEAAAAMLAGPRWGTPDRLAADARARFYLGRTRSHSASLTSYVDRDRSFGLVLDALARLDDPTAIETGTIRADEDWGGAGCSTLLLAMAFAARGRGHLHSVDCDPRNVRFARDRTAGYRAHVTVHEARGVDHLRASAGPIDLFYSDSLDADRPGHAENCLAEVKAAAPRLRSNESMVLIDDTVCDRGRWRGKGALAVPYLLDVGWRLVYAGYQALLDRHRA